MSGVAKKIVPEAIRFAGTVVRYRASPLSAARRYWDLYRRRRFSPDEIHFQGLLDPKLGQVDLGESVSKEELLAVQSSLNPQSHHPSTDDKVRFHDLCLKAGLPVPRIFALVGRGSTAHETAIPVLGAAADVQQFLAQIPAQQLIVKPVDGVNGDGVMRLDRRGDGWQDNLGTAMDATAMLARLNRSSYKHWMLQEVVASHPSLTELSHTTGLQTVRIVTVVTGLDEVEIVAARLRLICGNVAHDNFHFGKTGNVIALLNPADGVVRSAVGGSSTRYEMRPVTQHPGTGRRLIGFEVPGWPAVCDLAVRAALAFLPLRTIGWDVGITPDIPKLIEGNVTWAPLVGDPRMGAIYRQLRSLANAVRNG